MVIQATGYRRLNHANKTQGTVRNGTTAADGAVLKPLVGVHSSRSQLLDELHCIRTMAACVIRRLAAEVDVSVHFNEDFVDQSVSSSLDEMRQNVIFRLLDIQLQGRFKVPPQGVCFLGGEVPVPSLNMGRIARWLTGGIFAILRRLTRGLNHSLGNGHDPTSDPDRA